MDKVEKAKIALDGLLDNFGKVLTREYGVPVELKYLVHTESQDEVFLNVNLFIDSEVIKIGDYSDNKDVQHLTAFARSSHSFSDKYISDEARALNEEELYHSASQMIFTNLLFGSDFMDIRNVMDKWKEKNYGYNTI